MMERDERLLLLRKDRRYEDFYTSVTRQLKEVGADIAEDYTELKPSYLSRIVVDQGRDCVPDIFVKFGVWEGFFTFRVLEDPLNEVQKSIMKKLDSAFILRHSVFEDRCSRLYLETWDGKTVWKKPFDRYVGWALLEDLAVLESII